MIKYHDAKKYPEYDPQTHELTDNWNPDEDYGNKYVDVYFHIDTPSYLFDNGFLTDEARDAWHKEISAVIASLGIREGTKKEGLKEANLYAHPQEISGVVKKNDVKRIAEAIDGMKMSSIRYVTLYNTVVDISDEEYGTYLEKRKKEIRESVFETAKTPRANKYIAIDYVSHAVANKYRMKRLGLDDGVHGGSGQTISYIESVVDDMIAEGYLQGALLEGDRYVRSLNKTEMKKANLPALE